MDKEKDADGIKLLIAINIYLKHHFLSCILDGDHFRPLGKPPILTVLLLYCLFETIRFHDLVPGGNEIVHEFFFGITFAVYFGQSAELRI